MRPARLFLLLMGMLFTSPPPLAEAKAVVAHFMVGNTERFNVADWENNIALAQEAHVQAFALNMAYDWPHNAAAVELAFRAANNRGFKLFFSFDYAGNGPWPANVVTEYLNRYGGNAAHLRHNGKPLASTFEGPGNAEDWIGIKRATGCFFIPDWSSMGAGPALQLAGGVADGLFSWAAWPYGSNNMTTYVDASYLQALNGKPYMMPVSPWFYTNLPGYDKNWLWNGNDLWYTRWQQVWYLQPDFVQIISWNDYGESHHIGPMDNRQYEAFTVGRAPYNYAEAAGSHDGWRLHLPYMIDMYMGLDPAVGQESLVATYRLSPGRSCNTAETTGNTASQLQIESAPWEILEDRVHIAALLDKPASIDIEGLPLVHKWDHEPFGGVGLYRHSFPVDPFLGKPSISIMIRRPGETVAQAFTSAAITNDCRFSSGFNNYNPFVLQGRGASTNAKQSLPLASQVCVEGTGARNGGFDRLCRFTCAYGYCPISACVCTNMGRQVAPPTTGPSTPGYPANGDANYGGLCSFTCNHGFCPSDLCSTAPRAPYIPTTSPFADPACTSGSGSGAFAGLCSFSCNSGFCPRAVCSCQSTGPLNVPAPPVGRGYSLIGRDWGLCNFACSRGYCPGTCTDVRWPVIRDDQDRIQEGFAALGDSYSTGIGSGAWVKNDPYDPQEQCDKSVNSYPNYLARRLRGRPNVAAPYFFHASCTGAISNDIYMDDNDGGHRDAQLALLTRNGDLGNVGWATLSLGGNDAGFGNVATHCLFWSDSGLGDTTKCNQAIADSLDTIQNRLEDQLFRAYREIFARVTTTDHPNFLLVVTSYPLFFTEHERGCVNGFNKPYENFWPNGFYLDQRNRLRVNRLIREANSKIESAVARVRTSSWLRDRQIRYFSIDHLYEGHRFCELPPKHWRDDSWLHVIGPGGDQLPSGLVGPDPPDDGTQQPRDWAELARACAGVQYDTRHWAEDLSCQIATNITNGGDRGLLPSKWLPWYVEKALHPKSIANDAVAGAILNWVTSLPAVAWP